MNINQQEISPSIIEFIESSVKFTSSIISLALLGDSVFFTSPGQN